MVRGARGQAISTVLNDKTSRAGSKRNTLDCRLQDDVILCDQAPSNLMRKYLVLSLIVLIVVYVSFAAFIWRTMHQPPEAFARVMARMPGPVVFLLLPFETLWTHARTGNLRAGDAAPDFSLMKLDKSATVQLSTLTAQQPVVLVFGSYT